MKKVITRYICDRCKEDVSYKDLVEVFVPSKNFDCEGRSYTKGVSKVEICKKCFENYWNLCIDNYWNLCIDNFSETDNCYSVKMNKKF